MPKLAREFHNPRVKAYQIAIDAIERAWESPEATYAEHVELRYVMEKIKRERDKFSKKFNLELEPPTLRSE